jgi:ribosome-binding ATPase YchF (GTP1/OBG family)
MDAILHVVRCFEIPDVMHVEGSINPVRDVDTVETELVLADLEIVENSLDRATARCQERRQGGRRPRRAARKMLRQAQRRPRPPRARTLARERKQMKSMGMITAKKSLFVANIGEGESPDSDRIKKAKRARRR